MAPAEGVSERVDAMLRRVQRRMLVAGLGGPELGALDALHEQTLARRLALVGDDEHPDVLHPSRTALILMDDAGVRDGAVLAAALMLETDRPELEWRPDDERTPIPEGLALVERVPHPRQEGDRLLEALVAAEPPVALVALAERLDHARHLFRRERASWEAGHALACETYRPVAHRTHPRLAQRYEAWCFAFGRRLRG